MRYMSCLFVHDLGMQYVVLCYLSSQHGLLHVMELIQQGFFLVEVQPSSVLPPVAAEETRSALAVGTSDVDLLRLVAWCSSVTLLLITRRSLLRLLVLSLRRSALALGVTLLLLRPLVALSLRCEGWMRRLERVRSGTLLLQVSDANGKKEYELARCSR